MKVPEPVLRVLERRYRATKAVMTAIDTLQLTYAKDRDDKLVLLNSQECYIEKIPKTCYEKLALYIPCITYFEERDEL